MFAVQNYLSLVCCLSYSLPWIVENYKGNKVKKWQSWRMDFSCKDFHIFFTQSVVVQIDYKWTSHLIRINTFGFVSLFHPINLHTHFQHCDLFDYEHPQSNLFFTVFSVKQPNFLQVSDRMCWLHSGVKSKVQLAISGLSLLSE